MTSHTKLSKLHEVMYGVNIFTEQIDKTNGDINQHVHGAFKGYGRS